MTKYYILDEDGSGYAFWETTSVEVTVHEDSWPPPHKEDPEAFETVTESAARGREPRARGGVDDWLRENYPEHTRVGSDGLDEIVTLSLTREEARALEQKLESVLAKLRERLTRGDESARLEE